MCFYWMRLNALMIKSQMCVYIYIYICLNEYTNVKCVFNTQFMYIYDNKIDIMIFSFLICSCNRIVMYYIQSWWSFDMLLRWLSYDVVVFCLAICYLCLFCMLGAVYLQIMKRQYCSWLCVLDLTSLGIGSAMQFSAYSLLEKRIVWKQLNRIWAWHKNNILMFLTTIHNWTIPDFRMKFTHTDTHTHTHTHTHITYCKNHDNSKFTWFSIN